LWCLRLKPVNTDHIRPGEPHGGKKGASRKLQGAEDTTLKKAVQKTTLGKDALHKVTPRKDTFVELVQGDGCLAKIEADEVLVGETVGAVLKLLDVSLQPMSSPLFPISIP
jgi:hypothetical protein